MDLRLVTVADGANPNEHDLYLDASGQLEWIGGDITDQESYVRMIAQRIKCRLMFVRQEWYLDQRQGTPWHETIWRKGATEEILTRVFAEVIRETPGVQDLASLSVTLDGRSATVEFEAVSDLRTPVTSADLDAPMIVEVPRG